MEEKGVWKIYNTFVLEYGPYKYTKRDNMYNVYEIHNK